MEIPFTIPSNPDNNTWDSYVGATGPKTLTIPVNRANVREVHTLFNCSYGSFGQQLTTLDFYWSDGTMDHKVLTAGVDIRDWWWNGGSVNTISPPTVQVYSGTGTPDPHLPTRVDKQIFTFNDSVYAGKGLEKIVVTDNGAAGVYRSFLYGLTRCAVFFMPDHPFSCFWIDDRSFPWS